MTGNKLLLGCLGAFVLFGCCCGGIIGIGVYKSVQFGQKMEAEQKAIEEARRAANENPWTTPADGGLDGDRLDAYLSIRAMMHAEFQANQDAWKKLEDMDREGQEPSASKVFEAIGNVFDLMLKFTDMLKSYYQALQDNQMNEQEFQYYTSRIYVTWLPQYIEAERAAGRALPEALQSYTPPAGVGVASTAPIPEAGRAFLRARVDRIAELTLAAFDSFLLTGQMPGGGRIRTDGDNAGTTPRPDRATETPAATPARETQVPQQPPGQQEQQPQPAQPGQPGQPAPQGQQPPPGAPGGSRGY